MAKEYWSCFIGPIDRSRVPDGGDFPIRQAVKNAYYDMFGGYAPVCNSGWGINQELYNKITKIRFEHFEDKTVRITQKEYEQFLKDSQWLNCLDNAGVDNWPGIDLAIEMLDELNKDEEI